MRDWKQIRAEVDALPIGKWYALEDEPYSTAAVIRQGDVKCMAGITVVTRNTRHRKGRRICDVYLRNDER